MIDGKQMAADVRLEIAAEVKQLTDKCGKVRTMHMHIGGKI